MGATGDFIVSSDVGTAMSDDFSTHVLNLRTSRWIFLNSSVGQLWHLMTEESATVNEALGVLASKKNMPRDEMAHAFTPIIQQLVDFGLLVEVLDG